MILVCLVIVLSGNPDGTVTKTPMQLRGEELDYDANSTNSYVDFEQALKNIGADLGLNSKTQWKKSNDCNEVISI